MFGGTAAPLLQKELTNPPEDGVSSVRFSGVQNLLVVTSWDKGVRLYDADNNQLRFRYDHKAAVLDACFSADGASGFSGGLDSSLLMCDWSTGKKSILGSHDQGIKCVKCATDTSGVIITGSWDGVVKMWDPRSSSPLVGFVATPDSAKVFTMDVRENRLVVGTSNRHVLIYDLRSFSQPEQVRESSLMNQTRCIRIMPNCTGYALSSIEGRVAIEYFDPRPEVQKKNYAFKCHRKVVDKVQTLYPVNAIAYHPKQGTFATGGCDGVVNVWDGEHKKRICQYPPYQTSIAAMDFSSKGDLLAVAASYTFEEGEKDHPADAVFIRNVNDHEVRRKVPRA